VKTKRSTRRNEGKKSTKKKIVAYLVVQLDQDLRIGLGRDGNAHDGDDKGEEAEHLQ
jgi:hypothetical protein